MSSAQFRGTCAPRLRVGSMEELRVHQPAPIPQDPIQAAAAGDRSARQTLVQRYGASVFGLCKRLDTEPEDAYQEIWEKVFAALGRFDPDGTASFRTWIMTITRRHLIDRHRRRATRGEVVPLGDHLRAETDPGERLDRAQRTQRLESAIRRLPEAQRRAVVLFHIEGRTLQQIAADEQTGIGTIKSRLHRARARLASWMPR